MQISHKYINNAINRKFIRPLKDGCIYNVSKLENEGFTVNVSESYNSSVAKGLVYAQSPDGNSPAKKEIVSVTP